MGSRSGIVAAAPTPVVHPQRQVRASPPPVPPWDPPWEAGAPGTSSVPFTSMDTDLNDVRDVLRRAGSACPRTGAIVYGGGDRRCDKHCYEGAEVGSGERPGRRARRQLWHVPRRGRRCGGAVRTWLPTSMRASAVRTTIARTIVSCRAMPRQICAGSPRRARSARGRSAANRYAFR